jgi:hypothetical protein
MLFELRTYNLKPYSVPEFEKRFAEGLETREKYSPLVGFWHTDIGPLNQVLHLWKYENLQERADARAASVKDPSGLWPPKVMDLVDSQESDILIPGAVNDPMDGPREWGNLYELRMYTYPSGTVRKIMDAFCAKVPERAALSPLGGFFMSDLGQLNRFYQLWPYKDWAHRDEMRKIYAGTDIWPPHTDERPVHQLVRHMVPASFSPLH